MIFNNKNDRKRDFQKLQKAFTLVEILVALGLLTFITIAVSQLMVTSFKHKKNIVTESQASEFQTSLAHYIYNYCKMEFSGKVFPYNKSNPVNLEITNYKGFGQNSAVMKKGTKVLNKWEILSLTWEHNRLFPSKTVRRDGRDYYLVSGKITLTQALKTGNNLKPLPPHYIETFFYIDTGNYRVSDCKAEMITEKDICETAGYTYDTATKQCSPRRNCFVASSFVNCTSDRGWSPRHSPPSPCNKLILPELESGGVKHYINFYHNDQGGSLGQCPAGTTAVLSGRLNKSGSQNCGKKCTNPYKSNAKIYLCMRCN